MHKHKAVESHTYCWTGCVVVDEKGYCPNEAAHGGVVEWERCSCGATRLIEANGTRRNRTRWTLASKEGNHAA
jgi:hypothetical protein